MQNNRLLTQKRNRRMCRRHNIWYQQSEEICKKNRNNNVFNCVRAYIPNAQKCAFNMMFKECLSKFWWPKISHKISLVMTYG